MYEPNSNYCNIKSIFHIEGLQFLIQDITIKLFISIIVKVIHIDNFNKSCLKDPKSYNFNAYNDIFTKKKNKKTNRTNTFYNLLVFYLKVAKSRIHFL